MDYSTNDESRQSLTIDTAIDKKQAIEDICTDLGIDIDETLSASQTPNNQQFSTTSAQLTPSKMTFFNYNRNRERGESRKYSMLVKKDKLLDDRQFLITDEKRNSKLRWYCFTSLLNICLIIYMSFVIFQVFDQATDSCVQELKKWIYVYLGVESAHLMRKIVMAIAWKKAADPTISTTYVDFFFFMFIVNFQVAWFCYGAFIVFGTTYTGCITDNDDEQVLFWMTAALQIYGFIFMTVYFCMICFSLVFFILYRVMSTGGDEQQEKLASNVPYFNSIDNYNKKKKNQSQGQGKALTICSFCNKPIEGDQYVVECKHKHLVHEQCVQDQNQQVVRCRQCGDILPLEREAKLSLISERSGDYSDSASESGNIN